MAEAARGKLKIFFGAFPGAGKTGSMLAAARRMKEAGRDVVVGFLDLHGKHEDAPAAAGFENLASPVAGEFDLDAAIRRHPEVLLIDDLAHANPPGARHPQRWNGRRAAPSRLGIVDPPIQSFGEESDRIRNTQPDAFTSASNASAPFPVAIGTFFPKPAPSRW